MSKCTVLIIEDEKNILAFMGKVLKNQDYRVLSADPERRDWNSSAPNAPISSCWISDFRIWTETDHPGGPYMDEHPDHRNLRTYSRKR